MTHQPTVGVRSALAEVFRRQHEIQGVDRGTPYAPIGVQAVRPAADFVCGWAGLSDTGPEFRFAGDEHSPWSLQSCVKPWLLVLALKTFGTGHVHQLVEFRGAGHFASADELAGLNGKPRNPWVNPGAMVIVAALINHLGSLEGLYEEVGKLLNDRLSAGTQPFAIDTDQAEGVDVDGGSGNLAIARVLEQYERLLGLPPELVVEAYHTVCAMTSTFEAALEAYFFLGNGFDRHGKEILPPDQWSLLMTLLAGAGSYTEGLYDWARGRGGKTGGSGMFVGPTFANGFGMPNGVFAACSPGLGKDFNPVLPLLAAEWFSELTGSGLWVARFGNR